MGNRLFIVLIGVAVLFVICLLLSKLVMKNVNMSFVILFTIGALLVIGGVYLYPASSWRTISMALLLVGIVHIVLSIVTLCKKRK